MAQQRSETGMGCQALHSPGARGFLCCRALWEMCMSSTQSEIRGRLGGRCPCLLQVVGSDVIALLGEEPGHPRRYSVCLVWVVHNSASFGDLETTLGAASFPRVR